MSGNLYVVATPIGNLEDLTPRARQVLGEVDFIAAEDTRHTGRLLSSIGVKKPLLALHEHNEEQVVTRVIDALEAGDSVALVSDAGTPLISDPGFRLVRTAHEHGVAVSPIPGASAVTAALSAAGLPTDRFCFEGFLPAKQAARLRRLESLRGERRTMVFFESVHRIAEVLDDLCRVFGEDRDAFVGRELSKLYEQCVRAPLEELQQAVAEKVIAGKGEFVLVVAGASGDESPAADVDHLLGILGEKLSAKDAAQIAAEITGGRKNRLYERLLQLRAGDEDA